MPASTSCAQDEFAQKKALPPRTILIHMYDMELELKILNVFHCASLRLSRAIMTQVYRPGAHAVMRAQKFGDNVHPVCPFCNTDEGCMVWSSRHRLTHDLHPWSPDSPQRGGGTSSHVRRR